MLHAYYDHFYIFPSSYSEFFFEKSLRKSSSAGFTVAEMRHAYGREQKVFLYLC